VKRQT
ncbi:hypothetical protein D046_1234B, partial [Vibrio parahaemolyticus V-223/04]